jgi:hypothetical protein
MMMMMMMMMTIFVLTKQLTNNRQIPWSRVLKDPSSHSASQEIPPFYGGRRLITVFTRACHLSHPESDASNSPILILLHSHLRVGLPSGLFPSGLVTNSFLISPMHSACPLHLINLDSFTLIIFDEENKA